MELALAHDKPTAVKGRPRSSRLVLLAAALILFPVCGNARADDEPEPAAAPEQAAPVRIGMVNTLFRDVPQPLMMAMMSPFGSLMKAMTGVTGELVPGGDPAHLGQQLADDKVHLAVFHGIEFAWVQLKHPELQPLMIAVNQNRHLRCHLVVRDDCAAKSFAELKGQILALPRGTREHTRLFLERHCRECGKEPKGLFGKIAVPSTNEDALDDVVDNEAQAAIVDGVALDAYKRRKPARCAKLRSAVISEIFPSGVVAYHPGAIDEATLQRFREGMTNANKEPLGRQMLTLWKLTGFEEVPEEFPETLENIVKFYQPPAPLVAGKPGD
jgi:ABC-type phosphate/phosphonate transport system substrate-binding protein